MKKRPENEANRLWPFMSKKKKGESGSFAPQNTAAEAIENAGNASTNSRGTVSMDVLSPQKHRFMTALLDKLWINKHGRKTEPNQSPNQVPSSSSETKDLLAEGSQQKVGHDHGQAREQWLGETQSSDTSPRPMNFTYPPGSTPLPRHTIRRGIGMGGFGEVYFAVTDAGKEVALKRIQRNLEVELRGVSQCLNLKHPNLVALFDICKDDEEQSWVTMEYVAGLNLRQVLDQSPEGLPIEEALRWFGQIAAGVNHLHSAGLVLSLIHI